MGGDSSKCASKGGWNFAQVGDTGQHYNLLPVASSTRR
jgi:hypothetical protein